jgi:tight adherence protein B
MSFDGALALRYVAGVMNAGGSLEEALHALTDEAPDPLRRQAAARLSMRGVNATLQERVGRLFPERELRLARAALLLANEAGGSVGPLLERCARQLEDRRRWALRRKALSAQTVASAWIVGSMPIMLTLLLAVAAPEYIDPLLHTAAGRACVAASMTLTLAGIWMVRRMVRLDD